MYRAIPHLSPIGLSVIHQADEKHVECYIPTIILLSNLSFEAERTNRFRLGKRAAASLARSSLGVAQFEWPQRPVAKSHQFSTSSVV